MLHRTRAVSAYACLFILEFIYLHTNFISESQAR